MSSDDVDAFMKQRQLKRQREENSAREGTSEGDTGQSVAPTTQQVAPPAKKTLVTRRSPGGSQSGTANVSAPETNSASIPLAAACAEPIYAFPDSELDKLFENQKKTLVELAMKLGMDGVDAKTNLPSLRRKFTRLHGTFTNFSVDSHTGVASYDDFKPQLFQKPAA